MSTARAAARQARRAAKQEMTDRCEIRTPPVHRFNAATKANDVVSGNELIYADRCKVKAQAAMGDRIRPAGETVVSTWATVVSIPFDATYKAGPVPLAVDCLVKITRSADMAVVGRTYRVRLIPAGTDLTARRMVCEVYGG